MSRHDLGRPSPITGEPTTEFHHIFEAKRNGGREKRAVSTVVHGLMHLEEYEQTGDIQHQMDMRSRIGKMDPVQRKLFEELKKDPVTRFDIRKMLGYE